MTVRELVLRDRLIAVTGEGYTSQGEFLEKGSTQDLPILSPEEDYSLRLALSAGALCNSSRLVEHEDGRFRVAGDPTEGALLVAAAKARLTPEDLASEFRFVAEYPFDPVRKRMSVVYARRNDSGDGSVVSLAMHSSRGRRRDLAVVQPRAAGPDDA